MKYVTFYWSVMGGIEDVVKHNAKEDALKHFRRNYKNYFPIRQRFLPRDLPCAYGFPFRKFMAMSERDYKQHWAAKEKEANDANA